MQTFLPSTSFEQSAKWLDTQRLGKQRVECLQILKALTDPNYGWQNHPAVNMWRPHIVSLYFYAWAICNHWKLRGYKDTCWNQIECLIQENEIDTFGIYPKPPWLTEEFASNHRAILLGKVLNLKATETWNWYQQFNWSEQPASKIERNNKLVWPYLWPGKEN